MPEQPPISLSASHRIALHRLLALLLPELEHQGFTFSPDRYMGLLRLLETLPEEMPLEQWRFWLCPLLATDPEQQRQFYECFDRCARQVHAEMEPDATEGTSVPGRPASKEPAKVSEPAPVASAAPVAPAAPGPAAPIAPAAPVERRPLVVELEECTEPPFSWNIVPHSEGIPIDAGPQLGRTLLQLRRREWAEHIEFDLEATIRATLAEGGVPTFRYRTPTRPTEYLLLVERYAADDHRAALFDHFYRTLRRSEVLIERFFYTGDLRLCRNERYPAGLTLAQLHYRYPYARLVVVGTGYRFIRPRTGELAEWTRALLHWRHRVLLTPVPRQQWGAREHTLEQRFFLLPAALSSLHYLSGAPDEALHGRYETLPEYVRRVAETQPIALEASYLRTLRKHFDPGTLCWIAACAVYPALHFELTLRIGHLLSGSLGYNLLSAARLFALARLNWFTEGRIPYEARTELIEWLEHRHPAQHQQVLEYLCALMEQNPPPENSMAWAEHQINLALLRAVRDPQPDTNTAEQLRAVVKRLHRPQQRGDFVLPKNWEAILEKIGFADEPPPPETDDTLRKRDMPPPQYFKPDMVFVRGGTFDMGCTSEQRDCYSDEKPVTRVTVRDFYIGRYQVTFEEYDAFCAATGLRKPLDAGWGRGRRPVINVRWYDAVEYCNWLSEREGLRPVYRIDRQRMDPNNPDYDDDLKWTVTLDESANGYRLPTEAEWEYAARGGHQSGGYLYSGSNAIGEVAWYFGNTGGKPQPVGQKKANELGLHDMSGNVWEWCWDWYGAYPGGNQVDYRGRGWGSNRVLRGGSWGSDAQRCRVAGRNGWTPANRFNFLGFRLALQLPR